MINGQMVHVGEIHVLCRFECVCPGSAQNDRTKPNLESIRGIYRGFLYRCKSFTSIIGKSFKFSQRSKVFVTYEKPAVLSDGRSFCHKARKSYGYGLRINHN